MGTCGSCGCQTLDAYILLDRSGSMSQRWSEALGSINAYVKELAKGSATVTLATFDSVGDMKYEVLRDAVPSAEWKDVTDADAQPRGGTPLLDAIGRAVSAIESRPGDKKILIVMTDGEENQSREMNKVSAKAALDRFEKRGWQVVFLGADFDAYTPEAVNRAMADHHYHLQYHFYLVALDAHLRACLPVYDPEMHLGGVYYLFVRGVDPERPGNGVFRAAAEPSVIAALAEALGNPTH